MENYVVLRLCSLVWNRDNVVKSLIGLCQEHCCLKSHDFFVKSRPVNVSVSFRPNPKGSCEFSLSDIGQRCLFTCTKEESRTIFLNKKISQGVFRWTTRIEYNNPDSYFRIGVTLPELVNACDDSSFLNVEGSCYLCFGLCADGTLGSILGGVEDSATISKSETQVPERGLVAMEVDCTMHTLFFFVDGMRIPRAISHVPVPLCIGMSGLDGQALSSVSFRRLPACTPARESCTLYRYTAKKAQ